MFYAQWSVCRCLMVSHCKKPQIGVEVIIIPLMASMHENREGATLKCQCSLQPSSHKMLKRSLTPTDDALVEPEGGSEVNQMRQCSLISTSSGSITRRTFLNQTSQKTECEIARKTFHLFWLIHFRPNVEGLDLSVGELMKCCTLLF